MPFPADQVPDGSIWLAHHFVFAAWGALFVCWLATEDDAKPWLAVSGLLVALFSWYHLWRTYPVTGAVGVLAGLTIATFTALARQPWRSEYPLGLRGAFLLCLLIAWDDVLEHAFGVWMPLDWVWNAYLWHQLP